MFFLDLMSNFIIQNTYLGFSVLNNVSSLLLQLHNLKSVEITEVGSEGFLDDFLGPGGFGPFGAHVSSFPCFFDGGGLGTVKEFQLEFGQLNVVHVDFLSRVLGWAVDDDVVFVDNINDGEDSFLGWNENDSANFDVFSENHFGVFFCKFDL